MNAPVSRRALLGATAALGAVSLPTLALAGVHYAPATEPDAALFDLIAQHAEAVEVTEHATAVADKARLAAQAVLPPQPDALLWREDDLSSGWGASLADGDHYGGRGVSWLRRREPFPAWAARVGAAMTPEVAAEHEARRMEIIETWDGWMSECGAVLDQIGSTAADQAVDEATDLVLTLACEVKRARPRTLAGLRALAEWVGRQAEADQQHDDLLALFSATVATFGATE